MNSNGDLMAKTPKQEKKPEKKKSDVSKYEAAASKKTKSRTLTGKKAAQVTIAPKLNMMDSAGRPIHESTAVVVWGRMNPPTIGHEHLVQEAIQIAREVNGVPFLFLSHKHDKMNPLTLSERLDLVADAFGEDIFIVESDVTVANPIGVLATVAETFKNVIWLTGEDQVDDYTRIINDYNGKEFVFESAEVRSAGVRNPDSEDLVESISATQLRKAVVENDLTTFTRGLASKLQPRAVEIFEQVKFGLSIYDKTANTTADKIRLGLAKARFEK